MELTGKEILKYEKKANRGIAWLDKTFGREVWLKKIKLNKLDLGDGNTCMIGEVLGNYSDIGGYGITDEKAENMGFFIGDDPFEYDLDSKYSVLTAVWVGLLRCMGVNK